MLSNRDVNGSSGDEGAPGTFVVLPAGARLSVLPRERIIGPTSGAGDPGHLLAIKDLVSRCRHLSFRDAIMLPHGTPTLQVIRMLRNPPGANIAAFGLIYPLFA